MLFPRALLVLACAAPLLAAVAPSPDNPVGENGQCTSVMKGSSIGDMLTLPVAWIPAYTQTARIDIPNDCNQRGQALLGQRVTVCDADQPPRVDAPEWSQYTPVTVTRTGQIPTAADVHVYQYCG